MLRSSLFWPDNNLDLVVSCPYDKSHRVRKNRLPYHLVRCRQSQSIKKRQCPYNACHLIDDADFENHILTCPTSGNIKRDQYLFDPPKELGTVSIETIKNLRVSIMQDWKEENLPTYDPWKSTEHRDIIRSITAATKSQKKKFKLAERQRIKNLERKKMWHKETLRKNLKCKQVRSVSKLVEALKRLSLTDIDVLLKSIDISKLFIHEVKVENPDTDKNCVPELIEQVLVQRFKKLFLFHLKE